MNKLKYKWNALSVRQRVMLLAAALLFVLVVTRYTSLPGITIPTPGAIEKREKELRHKLDRLEKLVAAHVEQQQRLARVKANLQPYIWRMSAEVPSAEVQSAIDRIAREARVTIRTMGSRRVSDASDHFRTVEATVNLSGTMRDISRLLTALDRADRKFYWRSCRIRSRNTRDATTINFSGRLQVFFYKPETEKTLFASGEGGQ